DGHALQEAAAEAVGHLSRSPQADAVFRLLERLSKGTGGVATRAGIGLRGVNAPSAWNLVRAKATAKGWQFRWLRQTAADQLGYNDDPATRDLLLKVCREETDYSLVGVTFASARRLFGPASLEPHYQLLQNPHAEVVANRGVDAPSPLDQ